MDSFAEIWDSVKIKCQSEISEVAYKQWIEPLKAVSFDGNVFTISATSSFAAQIVKDKYSEYLKNVFVEVIGFNIEINFIVDEQNEIKEPFSNKTENSDSFSNNIEFNENYTFETFVVGSSNQFAYAAAKSVAENPGKNYNPLFIYGNSGLGKTHLLNAICFNIRKNKPDAKIIYTSGETFTNELILNLKNGTMQNFHEKYRTADILLLDDIQFISGKESTQEEFFHTFEAIIQKPGKHIVLTSDRPPKEISSLNERIRSRFENGLLADIQPPDIETKIAIIKRKATALSFDIPQDVCQFIAEKIKNNIRQLEGTVKKLKAYKDLENVEPTIISAQRAIKDILSDNQPLPVTIDRVISEVSRTFGISSDDIRSKKQTSDIAKARQVTFYIISEITDLTLAAIGEEFGKDHTTVLYSINKVKDIMTKNTDFNNTVTDIIKNIHES
ncbi:MAG: chromosomal replication initiator protein DnaA [Clostridiales bacterium]|nr:chromosomal replication initiator protein DnaA [Clostridiales bacterium]